MSFLFELSESLEKSGLDYCLVGGWAVALHGAQRGTIDIDIVLSVDSESLIKAGEVCQKLGLAFRLPIKFEDAVKNFKNLSKEKNLIALNFTDPQNPSRCVDIIPREDFDKGRCAEERRVGHHVLHVSTLEYLIKLKREAGREQDLRDLEFLEALKEKGKKPDDR